ncbi:hypothetical protein COCNU_scaffold006387G000010 [Cocos nucifera]|nr:hypothetical protein [Cocos nucifera]
MSFSTSFYLSDHLPKFFDQYRSNGSGSSFGLDSQNPSPRMGHQIIANIKVMNHQRSEVEKVWEEHQVEISHLLEEKLAKIDYLLKEKSVKVEGLQEMVQNTELILAKVKEELASEIERRKKIKAEMVEKEQ